MKLGKLEKIELRTQWENEASDFTPWLANEENIEILGDTLGLELEVEGQEKSVGPFKADILCRDTLDDSFVLIENQLERTDHKHLGQLITYASGLQAVKIVWISSNFTDEHRAALDWLNRITDDNILFFGLEIELYQIGASLPAPKFNIVSEPNDWQKSVKKSINSDELSETKQLQLEYWTEFKKYLENNSTKIKARNPRPRHHMSFAIGRSSFYLSSSISLRKKELSVNMVIYGEYASDYFKLLKDQYKNKFKKKINKNVEWIDMQKSKRCYIRINKATNPSNKNEWEKQFKWFKETLDTFYTFFHNKIRNIELDEFSNKE